MASTVVRNFIAKQLFKKKGAIANNKAVEFSANALENRLINLGIDPSLIRSEKELNQILNLVKQAEDQAFNQKFGNMLGGSKFDRKGEVFDMTGKKINPSKGIMGGKEINEQTLKEGLMKTDNPFSELANTPRPKTIKEREAEVLERMNKDNKETVARIKNRKLISEAVDNASPGFVKGDRKYNAQLVAEDLAEKRFGKDFYDLDQKQQTDIYGEALDGLDDTDKFAQGGRAGFKGGSYDRNSFDHKINELKAAYKRYKKGLGGRGGIMTFEQFAPLFAAENFAQGGRAGFANGTEAPSIKYDFDKERGSMGPEFETNDPEEAIKEIVKRMINVEPAKIPLSENMGLMFDLDRASIGGEKKIGGGVLSFGVNKGFGRDDTGFGFDFRKEFEDGGRAGYKFGIGPLFNFLNKKSPAKAYTDYLKSVKDRMKAGKEAEVAGEVIPVAATGALITNQLKKKLKAMNEEQKKRIEKEAKEELRKDMKKADGGRIGLKNGMDRRTFLKLMGGLASIPVLGKVLKPAKVASKAVKAAPVVSKSTPPPYFFELAEKIKTLGRVTDGPQERLKIHTMPAKDGKSELMLTEDLGTGEMQIKKINKEGDDMVTEVQTMEYTPGMSQADETTQGIPADSYDEYTEFNSRIIKDEFNEPDVVDGIKVDEIIEEVKDAPSIKRAGGGIARMLGE